jgi:hypothetical protein
VERNTVSKWIKKSRELASIERNTAQT